MSHADNMDFSSYMYEAKLKHLFIVSVAGIPTYLCTKASRPKLSTGQVQYSYLNMKRYSAGKTSWDPISLTIVDAYTPSGAQAVMSWYRQQFQPTSGRAGYASNYFKDITIQVLGPAGDVVQKWQLFDCFITQADFGDLDMDSDGDKMEIAVSIRFNKAILDY